MTSCFVSLLRLVLCGREVMGRLVEKKKGGGGGERGEGDEGEGRMN